MTTMTTPQQRRRKPGTRTLVAGIIAVPLGLLLLALTLVLAYAGQRIDGAPMGLLTFLLVVGGAAAIVTGVVRRLLAR